MEAWGAQRSEQPHAEAWTMYGAGSPSSLQGGIWIFSKTPRPGMPAGAVEADFLNPEPSGLSYTSPWSSMESATLTKPAMLAPTT